MKNEDGPIAKLAVVIAGVQLIVNILDLISRH